MTLSNTTKFKGLYTYGNELIQPEASLVVADNVNIDEPSVITPRRGFEDHGSEVLINERVKQLLSYKKSPLRHIENRIEFFRNGDYIAFDGEYHQVDPNIRIKYVEANSNFYFTTRTGIKKISAKSESEFSQSEKYITDAGIPKALDCFGKIVFKDNGFLPPQSKVAYKVLFGKKDVNNNLIYGTPSSRYVVANTSQDNYTYERTYLEFKLDEDFKAQRTTVTCSIVSQTNQTTSGNNAVLKVSSANNEYNYAFWFDKGTGVPPSITNFTNVKVDLTGASASDNVASLLYAAAVGAGLQGISVAINGTDVVFTNTSAGVSNGVTTPSGVIATDIGSGWDKLVNITGTDSNYIEKYFILHTKDKSYCFYYGNSETIEDVPTDPSLVGMEFVGIQISNNSTKSFISNVTSQSIQSMVGGSFTVELNNSGLNPILTLTDKSGGDIPDVEQGDISSSVIGITIVNQGSISKGKNANVMVSFTIPYGVDETFFYQIFRTPIMSVTEGLTLNDIDPGEACNLVYESPVVGASGTKIEVEDITPDTFRASGTPLYNNFDILQTNDQPPIAKDICNYQTFTFYANTSKLHRMTVDLIGMDSFVSGDSKFVISNGKNVAIYTFRGSAHSTKITCGKKEDTLIHGVSNPDAKIYIYSALDETKYVVYFDDGTASVPTDTDAIPLRVNISDLNPTDNVAERFALILSQFSDFIISDEESDSFVVTNSENGLSTPITTPNSNIATDIGSGWDLDELSAGTGEDAEDNYVLLSGSPSVALRIERTARSLVNVINSSPTSFVNAYYLSGLNDLPGKILLEARTFEDETFYAAVKNIDGDAFNPNLPEIPDISFSEATVNDNKITLKMEDHPFEDGEEVYISLPNLSPSICGVFTVKVIDTDHIEIRGTFTSGDTSDSFYFYPYQTSDNLAIKNRIYWSKSGQPEAVPSVNYIDIGTRDEDIERILSLRDYLFVLKTDGIFMISGDSSGFIVRQLDTERIACPDSAVVLNNQIYMLSTNSVIVINGSSPSIISRMIEDQLFTILNTGYPYRNVGFGVAYDDDRAYLLWVPTMINDTVATQCFRYNIIEKTWTRWTKTATCGLVIGLYPKLYIGDGDRTVVMSERKNRDRTDQADRDFFIEMSSSSPYVNGKYQVSDVSEIEKGDVITQEQYVTMEEYNNLLLKLDLDAGLEFDGYYDTFYCITGDNLASKLSLLNARLIEDDTSGTITMHTFNNSDWQDLQVQYNALMSELNDPNTVTFFKNYNNSTGSSVYEYIVEDINPKYNEVTFIYETSLILGSLRVYKHIKSVIQTNPIHFGNPSSWKQVSRGYVLFDQNNFYKMTLEYCTDLSPYFEGKEFKGKGPGFWGYGEWGYNDKNYWGGEGNDAPRRDTIPRNKQRCRYISVRLTHSTARDYYKIDGVAHDVREFSKRAYK